jgi:nucleotide-binding universal stress UspA family protein
MGFAALMVHAHPDASCEPRLRLAADLADQLEAFLIGVAAEAFLPPMIGAPPNPAAVSLYDAVDGQIRAELEAAEERFMRICGEVKKGVEWRAFAAPPRATIASQSRAADLVICGVTSGSSGFIERRADAADVIMSAGRPVLTGPPDAERLDLQHIVLAWKDTREARGALNDAMPLLARAARVLVVSSPERRQEEDTTIAIADVAELIRRHGGNPTIQVLPPARSPTETILEAAVDFDAQLIVAGAYGRSRMQEWAFGGVTRRLLRQDAKFVLFSH